MNDHVFPCKDCEVVYRTAEAFVDHVDSCVPVASGSILLHEAIKLLREWVKTNDNTPLELSIGDFTRLGKLGQKTKDWLEASKRR
jgi:hypothetical protein